MHARTQQSWLLGNENDACWITLELMTLAQVWQSSGSVYQSATGSQDGSAALNWHNQTEQKHYSLIIVYKSHVCFSCQETVMLDKVESL